MDLFQGRNLTCIRGERLVFAELSFSLASGGALILIGPNGSGKSSLLRILAGLLPAAMGALTWNDQPLAANDEVHRQRLHYIGHHNAVKPTLTTMENLAFWARLQGETDPQGKAKAALAALQLEALADMPGRLLSAGQKRRLALARLLVAPAPLWLLDEPTNALDRATIALFEDRMAQHRRDGGLLVISTHTRLALAEAETLDVGTYAVAIDPDSWSGEGLQRPNEGESVR